MTQKVVPMIHVRDVTATVEWYQKIGFTVINTFSDDGEDLDWAMLSFGTTQVMFTGGRRQETEGRRVVDLYVYVDAVDDVFRRLKDQVEVMEGLHFTPYGMREFSVRDLNGFWLLFGQLTYFDLLIPSVREGDLESVKVALNGGCLTPEMLSAALGLASAGEHRSDEIVELLRQAGAVPPPAVSAEVMQSYGGKYQSEHGPETVITFEDGSLFATPLGQGPLILIAIDESTFRPAGFDGATLKFKAAANKPMGLEFVLDSMTMGYQRVET